MLEMELMICFEAKWVNCYQQPEGFVEGRYTSSSLPEREGLLDERGSAKVTSRDVFQPQPPCDSVTCQQGYITEGIPPRPPQLPP